jgi:hypothetical protein
MADDPGPGGTAGALGRFASRARRAAQSLKEEYAAGKRGDDAPAAPIWASPAEQLDAARRLIRDAADKVAGSPDLDEDAEAGEVTAALRRVDWAAVHAATRDRTGEAGRAARTMAAQVDWSQVQPAARRVSTALIGAVASGQLGVGGPLGPLVARAIVDQRGFGGRVEHQLAADDPVPSDLGDVIDTTADELPGP